MSQRKRKVVEPPSVEEPDISADEVEGLLSLKGACEIPEDEFRDALLIDWTARMGRSRQPVPNAAGMNKKAGRVALTNAQRKALLELAKRLLLHPYTVSNIVYATMHYLHVSKSVMSTICEQASSEIEREVGYTKDQMRHVVNRTLVKCLYAERESDRLKAADMLIDLYSIKQEEESGDESLETAVTAMDEIDTLDLEGVIKMRESLQAEYRRMRSRRLLGKE